MGLLIVLGVLAIPFIEIALFIKVGGWIGVLPTIGLTILTTVAGFGLLQNQGISNLVRMRNTMAQDQMPIAEMMHALFLALAGVLLAIPGFFTDFLAALLLMPPIRAAIGRYLISRLHATVTTSRTASNAQPNVVDAEFWEEHDAPQNFSHPRLPPRAND